MKVHGEKFEDGLGHLMEDYLVGGEVEEGQDGEGLSTQQLLENALLILFGGQDTTAATMSSAIHTMLNHVSEEELEMLKGEVCDPTLDLETSCDALLKLPFLDAFVKETMRLISAVPTVFRIVNEDLVMTGDHHEPYFVKKGTIVTINLQCVLPDEVMGGDKTQFKVSRFLGPDGLDKKFGLSFNPFGFGGRMCLGMHLAKLEVCWSFSAILPLSVSHTGRCT
jgi:cytochrome P450